MLQPMSKIVLVAGLVTIACAASVVPAPAAPSVEKLHVETGGKATGLDWQKLVAEAKKEGSVVIGTSNAATVRSALGKAFKAKYGIGIEFTSGSPSELVTKVQAERRAGIYSTDAFLTGPGDTVPILGPTGALESLDNILIQPEVIDKKAWWGGDLWWIGPEHFQVMFLAFPSQSLWVNANQVKAGEITSYHDLLDPKWKGKISYRDPTMAGAGNGFFTLIAETLPNGLDFLRDLAKQEPAFTRNARLQTEWVARGKYPVAIGLKAEIVEEFTQAGALIRPEPAREGTYLTGEGGGIAVMTKAAHPKATVLFANWLLSKEGQTVAAKAFGAQSAREDVPTDFLKPYRVRQPGVKYHNQIQGMDVIKVNYRKVARQMYAPLLK